VAKLTRLTHKIAIQLHLVAESCTICGSRSRRPVRKLLDTPSYQAGTGIALRYSAELLAGWSGFESRQRPGIFFFTTASRPALGPTQPPVQLVPGALSLGVKRPGREHDHSPPSSAEVKNAWSYTSTPQNAFIAWYSVKAQGQFYLYITSYQATM
jgi:hypothetical protein